MWTVTIYVAGEKSFSQISSIKYPSRAQAAKHLPRVGGSGKITRDSRASEYNCIVSK